MNTSKEGHQWTPMNCVKSVINIEISMKTNKKNNKQTNTQFFPGYYNKVTDQKAITWNSILRYNKRGKKDGIEYLLIRW